jgi:hypothetical protein
MKNAQPPAVRDVAAEIGAEGEEACGHRDEPHRLPEQRAGLVPGEPGLNGCGARFHQRSDLKATRSSSEKSSGSSQAAKCPPFSASLKYASVG